MIVPLASRLQHGAASRRITQIVGLKFLRSRRFFPQRRVVQDLSEDLTLESIAGWVAPIATMIAAMMTAANLGARVTGWGFVVFTVGSICWSIVGFGSGQANLLATNLSSRWSIWSVSGAGWAASGRMRMEADRRSAPAAGRARPPCSPPPESPGCQSAIRAGDAMGTAVEALVECETGQVSYIVVASGGLGGIDERLRAVPRAHIEFSCDRLIASLSARDFEQLPQLQPGDWPDRAPDLSRISA
jgi:hypothetical protein